MSTVTRAADVQPADTSDTPGQLSDAQLHAFLCGQDVTWLAEELARAAQSDPMLRARLTLAAGGDAHDALDDTALRERLERAIDIDDFVDWRRAFAYFRDVDEALEAVEDLIRQGFPDTAITLAEYALELLEDASSSIDDSDGGLAEALGHAETIHHSACAAGSPEPVALAERLARRALTSDLDIFLTIVPDYAEVLGQAGMDRYREIVESAWRALPPKQARRYDDGRHTVTLLMERLAEHVGGVDALLEILATDVTSTYDILRIAETLVGAGRDDEALDWLGHGLVELGPDTRLRSLAAECHLRAARRDDALELLWANFADRPMLETYRALHDAAGAQLSAWRARALDRLRQQPKSSSRFADSPFAERAGHSTLVEVLLWEDDVDAAWQAAQAGGCRDRLWLDLARRRSEAHPADAIPILQEAAEQTIGQKKRSAYRVAAGLLAEAYTLTKYCDQEEQLRAYLVRLRSEHKPKRALREELDLAHLPT